jgi:hypothetical protein
MIVGNTLRKITRDCAMIVWSEGLNPNPPFRVGVTGVLQLQFAGLLLEGYSSLGSGGYERKPNAGGKAYFGEFLGFKSVLARSFAGFL